MSGGSETSAARIPVAGEATAAVVRERLEWIDALKGIGIIAVVAGHTWWRGALHDALYTFHMPLFFMLSGAVARFVPFSVLTRRLLRSLGVPFLSFSILLLGADFLIEGLRGVRPIFPSFATGLSTILLSTDSLRGPFTILWFAPCLLFARLAWNGLLGMQWDSWSRPMLLAMALVAIFAGIAHLWGSISPLGLLPVPAAILLLWIGGLWKTWRPSNIVSAALLGLALITLLWLPPVNLRSGDLGWPGLSLAGAVAIVYWLGRAAKSLPTGAVALLSWLGRRSLVIMFAHTAFLHYLAPYMPDLLLFPAALAGSLLVEGLARLSRPSRLLFLGERP